jgi:hypothetical protein
MFPHNIQDLISVKAAAELLDVSETTFWRARQSGLLPEPELVGGKPFYRRSMLEGMKIKRKRGRKRTNLDGGPLYDPAVPAGDA